ncbi:MAG: ATP-binding protein [Spirochaetes bacterium GWF1_51_8]|nr:MAG: ATP-binding protein [Spirochaetes bacterium GWF1_51_8]
MIEVKNVFHDYDGKGKLAVDDITFSIPRGEIFGFLGPSGAGKSTVQNLMTGLLRLQKGEINYEGKSIRDMDSGFFNKMGYSFEHPNLYTKLTGYENLKFYAGLFSVPTEDPLKLLESVGLASAASQKAGDYSKGMKQRLVFARSIINKPRILFLDEPLSGLDPGTSSVLREIIRRKKQDGVTIFLTTHNMFEADDLCDNVAFLNNGRIVAMDKPRNLKLKYGEKSVKVEYGEKGQVKTEVLFLDKDEDGKRLKALIDTRQIQTLHSQEATLEQIFMKLTGRGLS